MSELVTNAIKYAFPEDRKGGTGEVAVSFSEGEGGQYILSVSDNGIGLPEGFDPETSSSLGLKLVHTMVAQLGGEITLDRTSGTSWTVFCRPYHGAEGLVEPPVE
ncbi:MAG: sensor histidine kinase [bacterium]|nr:sensor histidine kinase [bacterium]MDT8366637.1 sensor histidine kinase [bacterium]